MPCQNRYSAPSHCSTVNNSPSDFAAAAIPAAASTKNSRSPVTTPALIASAGRAPSAMARATMAVTAGPGVSAATATVAVNPAKTVGLTARGSAKRLQPALAAEVDVRNHGGNQHGHQRHGIAPHLVELRHVVEVHAVDARDER